MSKESGGQNDPIERQIELALCPGAFIHDRACFSFVSRLEEVAARIGAVSATEPARGVALCEAFLAGCQAKADEVDDSSGSFGQFAQGLICRWIKARQVSGAEAEGTASRLLAWMDDDPYAFCYQIERDAAAAFDKAGLAAFAKQVRDRFEAAAAGEQSGCSYRHWSEVLRTIYLAQRDIAAYVALAERTGLTPEDCRAVGKLLVARRKPVEALVWIERGISLDREKQYRSTAACGLERLQRELLTRLGRREEALEAVWTDFRKRPSKYSYEDLMKFVPRAARLEWHERAMDAAKGTDLHSLLGLFVDTKEIGRLAELVRGTTDGALEQVSHYATEPAAQRLQKAHPGIAARLWRAQGMRILNAKKSKYYDAALSNFECTRDCYHRAGLAADWAETVRLVRAAHFRQTGFMSGFDALAAGVKRSAPPSFLDRAKEHWSERHGGDHEED